MRKASGHQCKEKMSGSEKKVNREHVRHFLQKIVTETFLEVSRCSLANQQQQRNVQKKCAARAKLFSC